MGIRFERTPGSARIRFADLAPNTSFISADFDSPYVYHKLDKDYVLYGGGTKVNAIRLEDGNLVGYATQSTVRPVQLTATFEVEG